MAVCDTFLGIVVCIGAASAALDDSRLLALGTAQDPPGPTQCGLLPNSPELSIVLGL